MPKNTRLNLFFYYTTHIQKKKAPACALHRRPVRPPVPQAKKVYEEKCQFLIQIMIESDNLQNQLVSNFEQLHRIRREDPANTQKERLLNALDQACNKFEVPRPPPPAGDGPGPARREGNARGAAGGTGAAFAGRHMPRAVAPPPRGAEADRTGAITANVRNPHPPPPLPHVDGWPLTRMHA